jgi:hypothetical protein
MQSASSWFALSLAPDGFILVSAMASTLALRNRQKVTSGTCLKSRNSRFQGLELNFFAELSVVSKQG